MKRTISFIGMPHSDPLEAHSNSKLDKLAALVKHDEEHADSYFIELHLKAQEQHTHHRADLHLKTPQLNLHTHDEGPEMYAAVDSAIDKMITQYKKEKEKLQDKHRRADTEKNNFRR
jgi:ribosomal subunit interface protein